MDSELRNWNCLDVACLTKNVSVKCVGGFCDRRPKTEDGGRARSLGCARDKL